MTPSVFTTVLDDDRGLMRLEVNNGLQRVFVHLTLRKWGLGVARAVRDGLTICKGTLRAMGVTRLNVIIPTGDPKLLRFEVWLGFREVKRTADHVLLEQEC